MEIVNSIYCKYLCCFFYLIINGFITMWRCFCCGGRWTVQCSAKLSSFVPNSASPITFWEPNRLMDFFGLLSFNSKYNFSLRLHTFLAKTWIELFPTNFNVFIKFLDGIGYLSMNVRTSKFRCFEKIPNLFKLDGTSKSIFFLHSWRVCCLIRNIRRIATKS